MGKINIGRGKVKRYWPGKAPERVTLADEDEGIRMSGAVALENAFPSQEDSRFVRRDDDRRLIRLAESRMNSRGDIIADHKRIRLADDDTVSTMREGEKITKQGSTGFDGDALEERRRTLREKLLKRQHEEEAAFIPEEEEEEFEYETDSENEMTGLVLVKPVFVSTSENGTIAERERLEARKRAHEEITEQRMEERKSETKWVLAQEIWKDELVQKNIELREANFADIDTDEEVKKEEELEAWMAREIARIKRDKEEPGAISKWKEETEKVRNMAEEEEMENVKPELPRKKRWIFIQKYHHKGVFFQSGADDRASTAVVGKDEIYKRDFSDPTREDKMDKTILPKVMQVKHFGRRGRTKWTHLANEDTTDLSNLWTYPLWAK
ncbi:hypothetical protein RHMOL_Rhmol07G0224100 [Rhododendron molle]|uniref:Uncharacterized protein n=1 Tax=Rhododendron molle TaxID=49168 RepID=A0ACC0N4Z3_RHOML|nr:hypothetical protein RHMOL_Rhmol07G0224100 [Rhododendron molle]